jgi:hypothetical protein
MLETLQALPHLAAVWLNDPWHVYLLQAAINTFAQAFPKPRENESRWYVLAFNLSHLAAHNWALLNQRSNGSTDIASLRSDLDAARKALLAPSAADDALARALRELDRLRGIAAAHGVPPALLAPQVKPPALSVEPQA